MNSVVASGWMQNHLELFRFSLRLTRFVCFGCHNRKRSTQNMYYSSSKSNTTTTAKTTIKRGLCLLVIDLSRVLFLLFFIVAALIFCQKNKIKRKVNKIFTPNTENIGLIFAFGMCECIYLILDNKNCTKKIH